jgi:hypothetical protein
VPTLQTLKYSGFRRSQLNLPAHHPHAASRAASICLPLPCTLGDRADNAGFIEPLDFWMRPTIGAQNRMGIRHGYNR